MKIIVKKMIIVAMIGLGFITQGITLNANDFFSNEQDYRIRNLGLQAEVKLKSILTSEEIAALAKNEQREQEIRQQRENANSILYLGCGVIMVLYMSIIVPKIKNGVASWIRAIVQKESGCALRNC